MRLEEIISKEKIDTIPDKTTLGIDIGSRQAKAVLINKGNIYTHIIPTGFSMTDTAGELQDNLLGQAGIPIDDVDYIVTTGYGRIAVHFDSVPNKIVTEISCHGLGAHYLGDGIRTIVDIGGQDSKSIRIDPADGKVVDFVMNEKCAAGTGRFLEKAANLLGIDLEEIGEISLKATNPTDISSQCVVFSESEIISARAKGEEVSDIAAGVHASVVRRIQNLLSRVGIEENVIFTGGVSNNIGMRSALEKALGFPIQSPKLNAVYAGALGAAIYAARYALEKETKVNVAGKEFVLDLSELEEAVERAKENFIKKETGKKKHIAYLCAYTPQEIMSAANVAHLRMFHKGNTKEVTSGETITQSIYCDVTKSIIGAIAENNPLYTSLDKIYNFNTCDCMRRTVESINDQFLPAMVFNLPRYTDGENSLDFYTEELKFFVRELEELTGESISEEAIKKNIYLYNDARALLRKISEYRKEDGLLFGNTEYQKIANAYYYLPVEEYIPILKKIDDQLENAPREGIRKVPRILLTGGILAEGDEKAIKILEQDLGARIVVEDTCTGYSPFTLDIKEAYDDPIRNIAAGYLGKAPCARMRPLNTRIDHALELAKEYKADAAIYYYVKFCPCYGLPKNEFVKRFQEVGIPVFELPIDYSTGDEGQLKTRIEAFINVLEE